MKEWPVWWSWELDPSPHVLKRMIDRHFTETDLREMLTSTRDLQPDVEDGRWVARAEREGVSWEVILEPDEVARLLVVITAYPVD